MAFLLLKFAHIASMVLGGVLLFSYEIVMHRAAAKGQVETVARIGEHRTGVENIGIGLMLSGIVLGVLTAIVGAFDLTQSWLLTAYGLILALIVLGAGFESPYLKMLTEAADSGDPRRFPRTGGARPAEAPRVGLGPDLPRAHLRHGGQALLVIRRGTG